ncbi:hypothetical protein [Halococcus sediminicola]|nr:hypothetical protein [Halococcus sediminicola]
MSDDSWTTIGVPQSVKERVDELKPKGLPPYYFLENLMDEYEAGSQ